MTTLAVTRTFPAGPKGLPVIGSLLDFRREGALDFYHALWHRYGDVASAAIGPIKFVVVVRPEHIQHVLVKNPEKYVKGLSHEKLRVAIGNGILTLEGEKWYRQRKLMQPTYTPKNIKGFATIMTDESQNLIGRWQNQLPADRVVVAYCRGPYCVLADEAVRYLRSRGFEARRLEAGLPEWRDAGLPTLIGA